MSKLTQNSEGITLTLSGDGDVEGSELTCVLGLRGTIVLSNIDASLWIGVFVEEWQNKA